MNNNEDLKRKMELVSLYKKMVKTSDYFVGILIIIGIIFSFALFFNNYTAVAIGLVFIGIGATIKIMINMKQHSKAIWYMWIAIIILVLFLLGLGEYIPKIKLG